ncbi:PVC-type heme-binding CxxCH protein [Neolewinella litorea]|nr:PVC-type heme-binding CxxCH protein [Neolewinella litorea]
MLRPLLLSSLVLLLTACQPEPTEEASIDFSTLSEADKRLPEHAAASFTLHHGLGLQTFASEPMMTNPTNLDVDERGRVWICEAQNYRRFNHDHPERTAGDRILIMEDLDQDGRADTAKVFYQGPEVNAALGIAKLGDKVYVAASPNLLVFTDADGDDVPEHLDTLFTGLSGVDHDHGVHAVVFGPDGKLYFNFGNEGKRLRLKNGELARDLHGQVVEEGKTFRQGMIFRCNPDGSELEIMGHNFRNNFEVALDPFGRMWQSDNDDDGNEGTRINYVMDYGNYGYHDEITGAAWQQARVGMDPEIPKRHWHLNDPGVVPNLLQTGSGSPTGILVYEGESLPEVFHGQMIHCEPGHNVVRSYPVTPDGSGYAARIVNLMKSEDQWFRPSDVCTAPDGSLFVSDWYDSGVGGHLMADIERGRVYRLYGSGAEKYQVTPPNLKTPDGALAALNHPNQATRHLAYRYLADTPEADNALRAALSDRSTPPRTRARAAWVLAERNDGMEQVAPLLWNSDNRELQELALRMARQYPGANHEQLLTLIEQATSTDNPALLREAALGLRYLNSEKANALFARLANRYTGNDRWYLEALGIASDRYPSERYAAWLATEPDLAQSPARDLVWRSRAPEAIDTYERYLQDAESPAEMARFFRALHFQAPEAAEPVIERAIFNENHPRRQEMVRYALASLDPDRLQNNRRLQQRVREIMPELRGSDVWLMVADNAKLKSEAPVLLDSALVSADNSFRERAAQIAYGLSGPEYYLQRYRKADATEQTRLVDLARYLQHGPIIEWLKELRTDATAPTALRQTATRSLANMWNGMAFLLAEIRADTAASDDSRYVARVLTQAWRSDIREGAISWLGEHRTGEEVDLNAIARMEGDPGRGGGVFTEYCAACHQVNGQGVRFGPKLDHIGEKLDAGGLLAAIAYPSQGIGFGYEGYAFTLADGSQLVGYIESQTEDQLTVRMMGGVSRVLEKSAIQERQPLGESLMTEGLHTIMEEQELADLLAYLQGLQAIK